jgi:hypothetical protein
MAIAIQPYQAAHVAEVKAFNRRLAAGGAPAEYVFPENPEPVWLPKREGSSVYNEFFLAVEDGQAVRGVYALKRQVFHLKGEPREVTYYHHPFGEGIVNKEYAQTGLRMLMTVQRGHPYLYCLGMGGYDRPLPQMLVALKWKHCLVPFRFRVVRPKRFLTELRMLQRDPRRKLAARLAAHTGLGWAGLRGAQWMKNHAPPNVEAEEVASFDGWADGVWRQASPEYRMLAVRDEAVLRQLYRAGNRRFLRLRIRQGGEVVGWAVVTDTQKQDDPQYGNLRLGWLVDALASPKHAPAVVAGAWRYLEQRGVDLIQTNQSHAAWVRALDQQGFWTGPSNFVFAVTGKLAAELEPWDAGASALINRADGDGLYPYEF